MKKRRVLALLHEYLVPPDDVRGVDVVNASWKTEYDVTNTLAAMGHDVYIVGLDDTLEVITETMAEVKPSSLIRWRKSAAFCFCSTG